MTIFIPCLNHEELHTIGTNDGYTNISRDFSNLFLLRDVSPKVGGNMHVRPQRCFTSKNAISTGIILL